MTTEPEPDRPTEPDGPMWEPTDTDPDTGATADPEEPVATATSPEEPVATAATPEEPTATGAGPEEPAATGMSPEDLLADAAARRTGDPFAGAGWQQPPGTGYPPPFSAATTPPGTAGYATRFGLARPVHNRYIAGVCGAFARATNTDPVLWRVALPVLTVLGGLGGLIYVLGWLLIPSDGDTASPLESLVGRGWSSTSRGLTVVLAIVATVATLSAVTRGILGDVVVGLAIIGGVVLLATGRGSTRLLRPPPGDNAWRSGPAGSFGATGPVDTTGTASPLGPTGSWSPTGGYRPPFAPGGPFAGPAAYADTSGYADTATTYSPQFPGLATAPVPPVRPMPRRPRRRSTPARRITLSCVLLVVGVLAVIDAANVASVSASTYFAAALATVGLGLIVGSFFGRARGPITLGIFLVLGLIASASFAWARDPLQGGDVTVRPASISELDADYSERVGKLTVDLRHVDFTGVDKSLTVHLNVGKLTVILPPDVDVRVTAKANVGATHVLDHDRSGINPGALTVTDNGADGAGGGQLTLTTSVNVGDVEVTR